ncbi:MAG TPA: cytochrome c [Candidatus Margulisiibacteriota bacterium]|nr:cytochrome c [Candidatus Margulisiibacteriota bacterium]
MRKTAAAMGAMILLVGGLRVVRAHEANLPAGPIQDRHELMEGIGKNAKIIGDSLKAGGAGDRLKIGDAALKIQTSAAKIAPLFPPGSTDPKSRAKPEIWTHWDKFQENAKKLEATSGELANAAQSGGDVKTAADTMFGACKSCHDEFRVPEKKGKK